MRERGRKSVREEDSTQRQSLEAPEMALPAGALTLGRMKGLVTEG